MALTAQQRAELERIKKKYGYTSAQETIQQPKKTLLQKASDISEKFLKTGAELTINAPGRALLRPFVETTKAVQRLLPGGKTGRETVKTPFGDITPRILGEKQGILQSGGEVLETALSVLPVEKIAGKLVSPLVKRAEKLYQSVLKPTEKLAKSGVVQTGLKEGIVISKSGLNKARGLMEEIGENIGKVIDTGITEGKVIAKEKLIPYANELKDYFKNVLGGSELIKQVDNFTKKYIDDLPDLIPIKQAQEIKQATQSFVAKYYNREAPIKFEVQKQLARGLKEQIAEQIPEIAKLNARDMKLFGLEDALETALKRLGNKEIFNLSDIVSFGAGTVGGGAASTGVGATILYRLLKNPSFASSRAIFYNKLAKNAITAAKLGKWSVFGAIGLILSKLEED
jgi:hypothetical protein